MDYERTGIGIRSLVSFGLGLFMYASLLAGTVHFYTMNNDFWKFPLGMMAVFAIQALRYGAMIYQHSRRTYPSGHWNRALLFGILGNWGYYEYSVELDKKSQQDSAILRHGPNILDLIPNQGTRLLILWLTALLAAGSSYYFSYLNRDTLLADTPESSVEEKLLLPLVSTLYLIWVTGYHLQLKTSKENFATRRYRDGWNGVLIVFTVIAIAVAAVWYWITYYFPNI